MSEAKKFVKGQERGEGGVGPGGGARGGAGEARGSEARANLLML